MKKRWMKSVIETSKEQMPALPYQRAVRRHKAQATPQPAAAQSA